MMKNKIFPVIGCAALLALTGCGSSMPDLTEEQSSVITEYAASLLLKYDKNYNGGLELAIEETEEVSDEVVKEPEESPEKKPEESSKPIEETPEVDEDTQNQETTIQDFCGLSGVEFTYVDFLLAKSYSGQDDTELTISFDAAEGNILAVLEFDVQNVTAQPMTLNMLELNLRFQMETGGNLKRIQPTMLMNDMATFKGEIAPGEVIRLALVAEYEDGTVSQDETIALYVKKDSERAKISLE